MPRHSLYFQHEQEGERQMSKVAANTAFVLAGGGCLGMVAETVLKLRRRLGT
jgi:hypothetical protein